MGEIQYRLYNTEISRGKSSGTEHPEVRLSILRSLHLPKVNLQFFWYTNSLQVNFSVARVYFYQMLLQVLKYFFLQMLVHLMEVTALPSHNCPNAVTKQKRK